MSVVVVQDGIPEREHVFEVELPLEDAPDPAEQEYLWLHPVVLEVFAQHSVDVVQVGLEDPLGTDHSAGHIPVQGVLVVEGEQVLQPPLVRSPLLALALVAGAEHLQVA